MSFNTRAYKSPGPVASRYLASRKGVKGIMGPMGSGKTNVNFMDKLTLASQMPVCVDGVIRHRHVEVRDTYANLWGTTIKSWWNWYAKEVGEWKGSEGRRATHTLRYKQGNGVVLELEMQFLAIEQDRVEDVLRGIEFTSANLGEADLQPEEVLTYLQGRCIQRRFPPPSMLPAAAFEKTQHGELQPKHPAIVSLDYNPPDDDNWLYRLFEEDKPGGYELFKQPSGRGPNGENRQAISRQQYEDMAEQNKHKPWWVRRFVDGLYGYDRSGDPVFKDDYDDAKHCATEPLKILDMPIRISFDQGITSPAMTVSQFTYTGQYRVLREFAPGRMGVNGFADRCKMILRTDFKSLPVGAASCDPSARSGQDTENGANSWHEVMERVLELPIELAWTNEVDARLDAVRQVLHFDVGPMVPGFLMDPSCKLLRRGFNSMYRYKQTQQGQPTTDKKPDKSVAKIADLHDAVQYDLLNLFGPAGVLQGELGRDRKGRGRQQPDDDDDDFASDTVVPSQQFRVF